MYLFPLFAATFCLRVASASTFGAGIQSALRRTAGRCSCYARTKSFCGPSVQRHCGAPLQTTSPRRSPGRCPSTGPREDRQVSDDPGATSATGWALVASKTAVSWATFPGLATPTPPRTKAREEPSLRLWQVIVLCSGSPYSLTLAGATSHGCLSNAVKHCVTMRPMCRFARTEGHRMFT